VYADTTGFVTFPQTRADGQYVVSLTTSYSYWRGDPDGGHTNVITQEVIEMDIVYAVQYLSSGTVADGSWTDWAIVRTLGDYPETHDGLHSFTDTLSVVPGSYFRIRGSVVDPGPIKDRLVQDFGIGFIWQQRVKEDSPPPVYVNAAGNPVGVEATPAALQVSVHPNPSSDWVKVDMRGGTVGTVHVFDVLGRRVRTVQGPEIPVRDLPSGQYALLVGTGPLQPQVVSVVRITVVH